MCSLRAPCWVYSHSYRLPVFSASQSSSLISSATAAALLSSGAVDYCLHVLRSLLEYWKSQQSDEEPVATSQLLKPHTTSSPPDMSPFFLRQYVKVRSSPDSKELLLSLTPNPLFFTLIIELKELRARSVGRSLHYLVGFSLSMI